MGVLFRQVAKYQDRPFLHFHGEDGPWQVLTWQDVRRQVLAIASGLIDAGIKPRDAVLIMSENRVEWILCDFAIQSIGAVTVPVYPNVSQDAVRAIANNSGATFAIASDADLAAKLAPTPTVTMEKEIAEWVEREPKNTAEIGRRLRALSPDDICTIIYTSGTTGEPKGVELAHRNLVDCTRAASSVHPITDRDSTLSWLPYAHSYGRISDFFVAVVIGMETWISRGRNHLPEEIPVVRPTLMNNVPRIYEVMYARVMAGVRQKGWFQRRMFDWAIRVGTRYALNESPGPLLRAQHALADQRVLASIRTRLTGGRLRFLVSGGAGLAREIEEFFWALGVPILNGWGLTETSAGVCSNTLHQHRFLTVGKPFPGVEVKIAPDGEIMVKGPGNMLGYHKQPEATAEVFNDGWFYSGDIGEIDADGFLKITDRKKSLFKTAGGKYIAPIQIEHELLGDPLVVRAVIVGEGRPYVTALIVPDWDAAKAQSVDVQQRMQQTVDRVNSKLGHWETVKYFTLLPHDFTEESGELSLKFDVKRKVVAEHYRDEIEAMYTGKSKPA